MMDKKFKPLEPCFVDPIKVVAQSSAEAVCPIIDIKIGETGVVLMGYDNVKKLKDLCNYALSAGEWWDSFLPKKEKKLPKCYHIYDYADYTETHIICKKCDFKSLRPDPKWPDFKYHTQPCKRGSMSHDWYDSDEEIGVCKKCFAIGITHKQFNRELKDQLILPKIIANIIINDLMKHANEKKCKISELGLNSFDIAWLGNLIKYKILDRTKASKVIDHFVEFGGEVKEIVDKLNLWPTYDTSALEAMVDKMITDNPKAVEEILRGKKQALGFLMGKLKQVDKNIDSKEAMGLLQEKIQ